MPIPTNSPAALVRALPAVLLIFAAAGCGSSNLSPGQGEQADYQRPAAVGWQAEVLQQRTFAALEAQEGFIRVGMKGQSPEELPGKVALQAGGGFLPAPSQVDSAAPRSGSAFSDEQLVKDGAEIDGAIVAQNMAPATGGIEATFVPDTDPRSPQTSGAAYALYRFNAPGYAQSGEPQSIGTLWAANDIPSNYYVGLANWALDRWQWFAGGPGCVVTLDSLADYIRADGTLLCVVIVLDNQPRDLMLLQLGAPEFRATGALLDESNEFANFTEPQLYYDGKQTSLVNGAPAQHFLPEAWVGPVYDQGQLLSCTACAVAAAYNYELSREYQPYWNAADNRMRISPKWLYKETYLGQCGVGRRGEDITGFCYDTGGCSMRLAYYDGNCTADYDKPTCLVQAGLIKAAGWKKLWDHGDWAIDEIKVALYEWQRPVIFTITLDSGFEPASKGIWTWNGGFPDIPQLHSMLIIGYDDTKQAFLVRNSWGDGWGQDGNCWVSYATFHTAAMRSCFVLKGGAYNEPAATHFQIGSPNGVQPPKNLQVSTEFEDRIQLTWNAAPNATAYKIYRDKRSNLIATVDTLLYQDTSVTDFLTHSYWVRSVVGTTESAASAFETGSRWTPPVPPTITTLGKNFIKAPVGTTVQFLAKLEYSSGEVGEYDWYTVPNDAVNFLSSDGTQSPYVVLMQPGTHTAHFNVTTGAGVRSGSFTFEVTIDPPVASISAPTSAPYGTSITFDGSGSTAPPPGGTVVEYQWDTNGDELADQSSPYTAYKRVYPPGNHMIGLRVRDSHDGLSAWVSHNFIVHSWGDFRISADDAIQSWFAAKMVNGRPAAAWYDLDEGTTLWYVRANDAYGSSWPAPEAIATHPGGFYELQLEMINNAPAIAAITRESPSAHHVVYLRATDSAGDDWSSVSNLYTAAADQSLSSLSLVQADGMPAIAFQETIYPFADSDRIRYIQASDASGTNWPGASTLLDGTAGGVRYMDPALAIVDGRPAIAVVMRDWLLPSNRLQLQYGRATDPDGTAWPPSFSMLAGYQFGYPSDPALGYIAGRPMIAFYSQEDSKALSLRSTDAAGSAWSAPVDTGVGGSTFALAELGGKPLLATVDSFELVFLQSVDVAAAGWDPAVRLDVADGTYSLGMLVAGTKPLLIYADGNRALRVKRRTGDF